MPYTPERAFALVSQAFQHGRLAHALMISGPNSHDMEQLVIQIAWLLRGSGSVAGASMNLFGEPETATMPEQIDDLESELVQVLRPIKVSRVISIDAIREVEKRLQFFAGPNEWKVVIIWDADRMREEAQNAFLKTLEEPPPRCLLILATSKPQILLPTIHSRCLGLVLLGRMDYRGQGGAEFIETMESMAKRHFGTALGAMRMRACFEDVLEQRSKEFSAKQDKIAAEEVKAYRNTTDGEWLGEREEFHDAVVRSMALAEQARFIEIMLAWLADVLRVANGCPADDFPECQATMQLVAEQDGVARLVRRIDALEDMRTVLSTTQAQQGLALDSGFLRVFGEYPPQVQRVTT